jgi:DNA invertase Pin-like site-specific DNA recombinase
MQNPRSPEQQRLEIDNAIARFGRPWDVVAEYCDRGISGRFITKRPELQRMLKDIESGRLVVGAILVDSYERWGRHDEMRVLRRSLWLQHRVLLLTVDSGFSDPTTEAGKALAFLEQVRSTSANAVRAHDVFRGKADAVRLKHWPGGRPPFGFRLRYHDGVGRWQSYTTLVLDEPAAPIVRCVFEWARDTGIGMRRLARKFNADPEIPACYKPVRARTVNNWLDNRLYFGEMVWGRVSQDIIDDVRICRANPSEEHVRVPDFCPAIVSRSMWERVQAVRRSRRSSATKAAGATGDTRSRAASAVAGLSQRSPLSGLVRCGTCGRSMRLTSGGVGHEAKRVTYYSCGAKYEGSCDNSIHVRGDRLWREVIARLGNYLGLPSAGGPTPCALPSPVEALLGEIREYAHRSQGQVAPLVENLKRRHQELTQRMDGWVESLGQTETSAALRERLWIEFSAAKAEGDSIGVEIAGLKAVSDDLLETLDTEEALARLCRLVELLNGDNLPALNVELHSYIDEIKVFSDAQIELRMTGTGAFHRAIPYLAKIDGNGVSAAGQMGNNGKVGGTPSGAQRRSYDGISVAGVDRWPSVHPARFSGLPERWFQVEPFTVPHPQSRFLQIAADVAALQSANPRRWTIRQLARHLRVRDVTVKRAICVVAGLALPCSRLTEPGPTLPVDSAAIQCLRLAAGLTRRKAAAAMSRCQESYRRLERGLRKRESPVRIDLLAQAFGCTRSDLTLEDDGAPGGEPEGPGNPRTGRQGAPGTPRSETSPADAGALGDQ